MRPDRRFWLQLCLHFGIPTVAEAQERIGTKQFWEWKAFFRLEGPEWRADLRTGIIASVIANANPSGKSNQSFKPTDFMPFVPEIIKQSTVTKQEAYSNLEDMESYLENRANLSQQTQNRFSSEDLDGIIREA